MTRPARALPAVALLAALAAAAPQPAPAAEAGARYRADLRIDPPRAPAARPEARALMEESLRRHRQDPHVYEEQSLILIDAAGNRTVRKARYYVRGEAGGESRLLLVFDDPEEVRGVALLAVRDAGRVTRSGIFLPGLSGELVLGAADSRGSHFLGTDFAIEDLVAENPAEWRYRLEGEREIDRVAHWVVRAEPRDAAAADATGHGARRHTLRKDTLFVVRTEYFDRRGRLVKRQSWRDLRRVDSDAWHADMVLMEDFREQHKTLIKVERRVFSRDYVPLEIFSPEWLQARRHLPAYAPGSASIAPVRDGAR